MKRLILITITVLVATAGAYSQNYIDALRYSQNFYGGTARSISMGNAFTSLGADLSAISINPAGTGMFRSLEISFSPQLNFNNTSTAFNGNKENDYRYTFNLPQIGIVGSLISHEGSSGLVNLNIAYSYNQMNLYNENMTVRGISDSSSMADYWARKSKDTYYTDLTGAAGIAFDTWLIDTLRNSAGASYGTVFSHYGDSTKSVYGQQISRVVANDGYKGEHAISVGANFGNKLFLGATLGITNIRYTGHYEHSESDINNVIDDFKNFSYTNHFDEYGTGYSLKIGAIIRPIDMLRIGIAYHTPTIYRMHYTFYDNISSTFDDLLKYSSSNETMKYDYTLTTPSRLLVGASVQVGKLAIVSVDYERVDYTKARFRDGSDGYDFAAENTDIKTFLKAANNLRLGAEFRLGSLYLRGGYGLYGNTVSSDLSSQKYSYNSLSGGIGYHKNNYYIDAAYCTLFSSKDNYYLYDGAGAVATLSTTKNTFTLTIGMKF
ncbi:MAG TPA: hypothetical protein VMT63_13780 [Bacteroidales bacterium]|nr:hypothetical protein [Bacteroidales bacterium]